MSPLPLRFAASAAALLACAGPVFAQAPAKVTYADHILPIFRNACLNCHNPDKKKAGLDLSTYQGAMAGSENGKVVNAGDAAGSLIFKVCAPGGDPKMPPKGDSLNDAEMALLKNWIAGFALETASSKPAAASQNKVAAAVVSLERPEGPAPMPGELPLEPFVRTRTTNALVALAASPWAPLVAVGGQKQIILYNTETLAPLGVLPFPEGFPAIVRFSRNGKLLMTGGGLGGKTGKVVLWDIATGERIGTVGNEVDAVLGADLSPDQQHVALGGPTRILKIYSTKDGKLEHSIKKHTDWVTAVAYSPDGRYFASADRAGGVVVWESGTAKEFNTLAGHKSAVTALAFMPGVLASASTDGKISLWDVKEGKEIKSWAAHAGGVEFVDFTPDGRLVSCGRDKIAKAWDQTGKVLGTSEPFADIALRAVMNGERIVAGDWTGEIRVISADGKQRFGTLTANPPSISEQLAGAQKRLTDAQTALPTLQQAATAAQQKAATELAAAQEKQKAAQAALEAAKAGAPALEKRLADERTQLAALTQASDAAAAKQSGSPEVETAQRALDEQNAKIAKIAKIAKTDAELKAAKAGQPAQIAAAEKALQEATAQLAAVQSPSTAPAPAAAPAAASQPNEKVAKKIEQITAELVKLRADRATKTEGSAEYAAADAKVQAKKPELEALQAKLDAGPAAAPAAPAAPKITPAQEELAKAKAALDQAGAHMTAAKVEVERWNRAQSFMDMYKAKESFADKKARHEELVQSAKDAFMPVDLAKTQLAASEKTVADAPARLKEAETLLASATQARDATAKALADAKAVVSEKTKVSADPKKNEAAVVELKKKFDAVTAEIAKRREVRAGKPPESPEYAAADAAVQALKPDLTKAEADLAAAKGTPAAAGAPPAEIAAAQEAVKKAELDAKLAADKVAPAEKTLAKTKQEADSAGKQIGELRNKLPETEKAAAAIKAKAEKDAQLAAKDLEAAKAQSERAQSDYKAKWGAPVATAAAKP